MLCYSAFFAFGFLSRYICEYYVVRKCKHECCIQWVEIDITFITSIALIWIFTANLLRKSRLVPIRYDGCYDRYVAEVAKVNTHRFTHDFWISYATVYTEYSEFIHESFCRSNSLICSIVETVQNKTNSVWAWHSDNCKYLTSVRFTCYTC